MFVNINILISPQAERARLFDVVQNDARVLKAKHANRTSINDNSREEGEANFLG